MDQNKTILFFNTNKSWGGGEKWHLEMAKAFVKKNYVVHVFAHEYGELLKQSQQEKIPITPVKVGKLSFLNPVKIQSVARKIKDINPQVIILNLPSDMKAGGLAAKKAGVPNIFYRRGTALPVKAHWINRYFFKHILTGVIANSHKTKELINKNHLLIANDRIHVIYNGIENIPELTEKQPAVNFIIGNAGRLVAQKGQDYLIELGKSLAADINNFQIHIAGDGPLKDQLQSSIKKHNLSDKILLTGFHTDLSGFYQSIDVFILPSRWEGFGYVMAEAMLHKVPVIAFDISSNPELIKNGNTGFLCPMGNIQKLKEKVLYLKDNPHKREEMGKNAREWALKNFTMEKSVQALEKVIVSS
ncbi:MAG: glycosyltransferase family 4 protein [Bacteroidota bacterium]